MYLLNFLFTYFFTNFIHKKMLLKFTAYFSKTILRKLFKYCQWTLFAKNWKRILPMTIFLLGETTKREISLLKCISRLHFISDQDQLFEMYYSSHYWFFSISTIYIPNAPVQVMTQLRNPVLDVWQRSETPLCSVSFLHILKSLK